MKTKKTKKDETFAFVVGHEWETGGIGAYAYGSEVHNGTMEDAKSFLKYVEDQSNRQGEGGDFALPPEFKKKIKYKIYKLVEVK